VVRACQVPLFARRRTVFAARELLQQQLGETERTAFALGDVQRLLLATEPGDPRLAQGDAAVLQAGEELHLTTVLQGGVTSE
jgi:hypothetical protein